MTLIHRWLNDDIDPVLDYRQGQIIISAVCGYSWILHIQEGVLRQENIEFDPQVIPPIEWSTQLRQAITNFVCPD